MPAIFIQNQLINHLMNIKDISDVVCPWNEIVIKDEIIELVDEDNIESENISDTTEYHENQTLVTAIDENHLKSVGDQMHENEKSQVTNAIINEIESHTDELDFKCEKCSASFNSLTDQIF